MSNIYNIIVWHLEAGSVVTILQVVLKCKLSWWVTCVYTWNCGKSHLKRVSNCNISSCPVSTVLSAVFNNIFSILCAKGGNADRAADTFLQCVSGAWLVFKYVSCTHELWLVVDRSGPYPVRCRPRPGTPADPSQVWGSKGPRSTLSTRSTGPGSIAQKWQQGDKSQLTCSGSVKAKKTRGWGRRCWPR